MKKKMLECQKHGLTLHRCKRRVWHTQVDKHADDYTEKCFKCISEGRYKKKDIIRERNKHLSF